MTQPSRPLRALDLFAGTGWGVACKRLGISEAGVENMEAAVATRTANGMLTIMRDVWDALRLLGGLRYDILIGSPPCQTFSMAGGGAGRAALDIVLAAIHGGAYKSVKKLAKLAEATDPRTALVLMPLAFVWRDRPRVVVLEQVPTVLPVWEACAEVMRTLGYNVVVGALNSEQYGVAQTRKRAVLIARLDGEARMPTPTHSLYHSRDKSRLDPDVAPWLSMAECLGWGMTERPYMTVASGTEAGGGTGPAALGGSGARKVVLGERDAGRWVTAEKVQGEGRRARHGERPGRAQDEPAFTVRADAGGMEPGGFRWLVSNYSSGSTNAIAKPGNKKPRGASAASEPASTLTSKASHMTWAERKDTGGALDHGAAWPYHRPAPTIVGSFSPEMIAEPGHRNPDSHRQSGEHAIRVTLEEAAALQSYPPGFVWVGNKTERFRQVGNAVPPLMAEAILRAALA